MPRVARGRRGHAEGRKSNRCWVRGDGNCYSSVAVHVVRDADCRELSQAGYRVDLVPMRDDKKHHACSNLGRASLNDFAPDQLKDTQCAVVVTKAVVADYQDDGIGGIQF